MRLEGSTLVVIPTEPIMSLDDEQLAAEFNRIDDEIQQQGVVNLVIDFEHSPHFGSVMLGAMTTLSRRLPAGRGELALCNVSPTAREVLQITRLDSRWPIYASRQEACESFEEQE
jgi:anti-anti-sigma factor